MIGCPLLLAGVVLLSACSKDSTEEPVPEQPQTAISFTSGLQSEVEETRAGERGLEDVMTGEKKFQLFGYKNDAYEAPNYTSYQVVMPNFNVRWIANSAYTTTTNTNDWEYVGQGTDQTIKYWDFSAKAYRFFGYALGNATASPATNPAAVTTSSFPTESTSTQTAVTFTTTVDASSDATIAAAPYFSRLWFSTGDATAYPDRQFGQPVQLQFLKPFARVRFMFTFAEGLGFGREALKNIKFRPTVNADANATNDQQIVTAGTVTVSYPLTGTETTETWTTSAATGSVSLFDIDYYENTPTMTYGANPEKWYTVLPVSTQGTYTVEVSVVTEELKSVVVPAEYMSWKAGYEYTYKFKITEGGGITMEIIQVAINDWSNRQSSDHTVYNW